MNITMYLTRDSMQFNLEPETGHEKEMTRCLLNYHGAVTIHKGLRIAECQGGFSRVFGDGYESDVVAINIQRESNNE